MRQVSSFGIGPPLFQQTPEPQQARLLGDGPVRTRDFPGVRLWHAFTLTARRLPREGYSRAVFIFLLRVVLNSKCRSFADTWGGMYDMKARGEGAT